MNFMTGLLLALTGHVHTLYIPILTPLCTSHRFSVEEILLILETLNLCFYKRFSIRMSSANNAINTTFSNGSLGSRIDEERSEMR